jgi:hypothetical protein
MMGGPGKEEVLRRGLRDGWMQRFRGCDSGSGSGFPILGRCRLDCPMGSFLFVRGTWGITVHGAWRSCILIIIYSFMHVFGGILPHTFMCQPVDLLASI